MFDRSHCLHLAGKPDPVILTRFFASTLCFGEGFSNPVVVLDDSTRKKVGRHYQYPEMTHEEEIRLLLREFDHRSVD